MKCSEIPEQTFEPLPEGKYTLGVVNVEKKVGKNSGVPYMSIEYVVTSGEYSKRKLYDNVSLSPKSLWILKKWLLALGEGDLELPIEIGTDGNPIVDEDGCYNAISTAIIGDEVEADVSFIQADSSKGWNAKNDVVSYSEITLEEKWDE